jgi:Kef-type K+ transport system membrane component KefB/mannitol/fructose-specific phosphotransferase system IIA component (Ntr-type)/nucleotide-binding universal stress UspA family protein
LTPVFAAVSLPFDDPVLIVAIAMGIFLLAPIVAQRLRLPGIIGIIVAGAAVGPGGFNLLARNNTIVLLGTVGLLYLIFMAGTEIDLHGFRRYRSRSLTFGALSYLIPQALGIGAGLLLGYSLLTSILLGSMFGSHTLLAYPIATRLGIAKNIAVTTAVGGTIVTDTLALLVLAVVAASTQGELNGAFWIRLSTSLTLYVVLVWFGLPRLARWYFRRERTGGVAAYVFVLASLFLGAWLAGAAGVQPIVGAFLVGLALNRLIPENSLLTNRIRFVGESIFIPFFLLSVGMLVDVSVLTGSARVWEVMIAMVLTVTIAKLIAAKIAQRLFDYSSAEGWSIYGLSVPQAAATLAATLIGIQVGLFDDAVLNGSVMMILVTAVLGPWVLERFGREVALAEEQRPYDPAAAPQRILVPMSNPKTAPALMDLALTIREPVSAEPVYPMTVVPAQEEEAAEHVAMAEKMLAHAVAYATGADVPVVPVTRVDNNFADGIARGAAETRTSTLIIGWDGQRTTGRSIFGSVLDQLLERSRQEVIVAKLGHPLNTTERIILLIPHGADHAPGFFDAVRTIKLMASRLGTTLSGYVIGASADLYEKHFAAVLPAAPAEFEQFDDWFAAIQQVRENVTPDDLVIALSARRGTVSWVPTLDRLPGWLVDLAPQTFMIIYPSESKPRNAGYELAQLPTALSRDRILLDVDATTPESVLKLLLRAAPPAPGRRGDIMVEQLARRARRSFRELKPGLVVVHGRVDLDQPLMYLATTADGIPFPGTETPARLVFVLLTGSEQGGEHLEQLAEIASYATDDDRLELLRNARTVEEIYAPRPAVSA